MCSQEDDTSMIDLPQKGIFTEGELHSRTTFSVPMSDCGQIMGTVERLNAHNRVCAYCGPRNRDQRTTGKGW